MREIDLRGRTLMPGFFDCHLHMLLARHQSGACRSVLAARAESNRTSFACCGSAWTRSPNWPVCRATATIRTNWRRPIISPGTIWIRFRRPCRSVSCIHLDMPPSSTRSALEMLGITSDTPDPVGGEIVRDASGQAYGRSAGNGQLERPRPHSARMSQRPHRSRRCAAPMATCWNGELPARPMRTWPRTTWTYTPEPSRKTPCACVPTGMIGWAEVMQQTGAGAIPTPNELQPPQWSGVNWHRLHVGQAKLFSDGAITTRTCWLTQPFEGMAGQPNNSGIAMHPPDELRNYIVKAHDAGWQIATHAIGDRAIDAVLAAYAEAQRVNTRHRPGHRIEHAMLLDKGLIARFRRQNVWSVGTAGVSGAVR